MKKRGWIALFVGMGGLALVGTLWLLWGVPDPPAGNGKADQRSPIAQVTLQKIRKARIAQIISVYGTVIPSPKAIQIISVSCERQILRLLVVNGQRISHGDLLLEIDSSPNTRLQFEQTRNQEKIAKENLYHMRQRIHLKIATEEQLLQAEQAWQQAHLSMESMEKRGIGGPKQIRAPVEGLVGKVNVQEGSIVPAGNPILELVAQKQVEIRLGVEPEDLKHVFVGQPVLLSRVDAPALSAVTGKILEISQIVNPATRLVDVLVTLPPATQFLPGDWILGKITAASAIGLLVPRSAVVPQGAEQVLYTVQDGVARKHLVRIGIDNGKEIQVTGEKLRPGDPVVILGNYELEDGMAVRVKGP